MGVFQMLTGGGGGGRFRVPGTKGGPARAKVLYTKVVTIKPDIFLLRSYTKSLDRLSINAP